MRLHDKIVYHQIHPIKLGVDATTGLLSTWLMWTHQFWLGMCVAWIPAVLVSALMLWRMDFSRQQRSASGRYVAMHMTRLAELTRMGGQVGMWVGGWQHCAVGVVIGFLVIVFGWTYSLPKWWRTQRSHNGAL